MPAMARRKELPYSFWLFDIATHEHPDAAAREVALWQQVLRDLPPDAPAEHRLDATVALLEALFPYMGLRIPADLLPDPWERLEQLAAKIPVRRLPWPTGLPRGWFNWAKARAVLDVVAEIDRPKDRVEVKGSRVMYHTTQDGARVRPLLDMPSADVRKLFQSNTYRWLYEALTIGEPEAASQPEAVSLSGDAVDAEGATVPLVETLGPYRRTASGAVMSQTITNWGEPLSAAPVPSRAERRRLRAQVGDLRSIASPSELRFIETILETGYGTQKQFADHIGRTPHSVNEMVSQLRQKAVSAFPWAAAIDASDMPSWHEPALHPGCETCDGSGWIAHTASATRSNSARVEEAEEYRRTQWSRVVVTRGQSNDAQLDRFLDNDRWRRGITPTAYIGSASHAGVWPRTKSSPRTFAQDVFIQGDLIERQFGVQAGTDWSRRTGYDGGEGPAWPEQLTTGHWSLGDLTRLADLDPMNEKAVREGLWLGGGLHPRKESTSDSRQPCPGGGRRQRRRGDGTLTTPCIKE